MRPHAKPSFAYTVRLAKERAALAAHLRRRDRAIPQKTRNNLLIASWNLTNFGIQERRAVHLRLMADVVRRFDVVAVQEVADDIAHLGGLLRCLGARWSALYTARLTRLCRLGSAQGSSVLHRLG